MTENKQQRLIERLQASVLSSSPSMFLSAMFFVCSVCVLIVMRAAFSEYAANGIYFQYWNTEMIMQTLPLVDLRARPLESLIFLHVHPPLLDALRAILAQLWPDASMEALVLKVDEAILLIWTLLYGLVGSLLFHWLCQLTNRLTGLVVSSLVLLSPAVLALATTTDTTFPFAVIVVWLYYELWKISRNSGESLVGLSTATVIGYFTRSVFQWPIIVPIVISLALFKVPLKRIAIMAAVVSMIMGAYTAKQYYMFGITYTSSFAGLNCCRTVDGCPVNRSDVVKGDWGDLEKNIGVLGRVEKLDGINFNNLNALDLHKAMLRNCVKKLRTQDISITLKSYMESVSLYFRPTSLFSNHEIVDRLFWRGAFDAVFSGFAFVALLILSGVIWLARHSRKSWWAGIGMTLPAAAIFMISVMFEKGENSRFKFFIEPVLYLFIACELYHGVKALIALFRSREAGSRV